MEEVEDALRDEYIKALKDEDFKALASTLSMSEDDLMKYTSKLQECSIEHSHCKTCKGLVECKIAVVGYALTPSVDNHN